LPASASVPNVSPGGPRLPPRPAAAEDPRPQHPGCTWSMPRARRRRRSNSAPRPTPRRRWP